MRQRRLARVKDIEWLKDRIMKWLRVSAVLVTVSIGWLLTGTALAKAEKVSDTDQQFLQQVARAGTAEVTLGAMATEQPPALQCGSLASIWSLTIPKPIRS